MVGGRAEKITRQKWGVDFWEGFGHKNCCRESFLRSWTGKCDDLWCVEVFLDANHVPEHSF